jgi:hypothetical protein
MKRDSGVDSDMQDEIIWLHKKVLDLQQKDWMKASKTDSKE